MLLRYFHENLTYQVVYLYILLRYLFRKQTWRCTYFGAELTFVAGIFSAKVSLILDYPFPVLFLFNWKRVSFILSGILDYPFPVLFLFNWKRVSFILSGIA